MLFLMFGVIEEVAESVEGVANSKLASEAPYLLVMAVMVLAFFLFLWKWTNKREEVENQRIEAMQKMSGACHANQIETAKMFRECVDRNTEQMAVTNEYLREFRRNKDA